jgi:DNA-binding NarL/FixJ family response regulator
MKIEYKGLVFSDLSVSEATMLAQALQKSTKKDNPMYERAQEVFKRRKVKRGTIVHWTKEDDEKLASLMRQGISDKEMARQLGRTKVAISWRKSKVIPKKFYTGFMQETNLNNV